MVADRELQKQDAPPDGLGIDEHLTMRKPFGWVFRWDNRNFLKTRDPDEGCYGCQGIIIVERNGHVGLVHAGVTPYSMLPQYEHDWRERNPGLR